MIDLEAIRDHLYGWHTDSEVMQDARVLLEEVERLRDGLGPIVEYMRGTADGYDVAPPRNEVRFVLYAFASDVAALLEDNE